jgi:hypothetical protein
MTCAGGGQDRAAVTLQFTPHSVQRCQGDFNSRELLLYLPHDPLLFVRWRNRYFDRFDLFQIEAWPPDAMDDRAQPPACEVGIQSVVREFRQKVGAWLEPDAISLHDRRAKGFWNDARSRQVVTQRGDHKISRKDPVFLKRSKMSFGDVRLGVNEMAVTDVRQSDDARARLAVVRCFQL